MKNSRQEKCQICQQKNMSTNFEKGQI